MRTHNTQRLKGWIVICLGLCVCVRVCVCVSPFRSNQHSSSIYMNLSLINHVGDAVMAREACGRKLEGELAPRNMDDIRPCVR